MESRLPELLTKYLGERAGRFDLVALAADVRDDIGELSSIGQADRDALDDVIRRHERPGPRTTRLAVP